MPGSVMPAESRADLGVLISFSGDGGVERMVLNLVAEFARRGLVVDLLTIRAQGGHLNALPDSVRPVRFRAQHTLTCLPELMSYLRRTPPKALLVAKDRAGRAALVARRFSGAKLPVWIRLGTNLSAALERKSALARWWRTAPMRRFYAMADGVIAVSEGVAEDTRKITGLPAGRVRVIRNPVITGRLAELAQAPVPHPWLADKIVPVILGVGRLTVQKDFATLLKAFARVQAQQPARLIILGEGGQRALLERSVRDLGLADHVALPGFQANPYAFLAHADLFVLSSAWEGSPNALTEALALGVPSVSTDCPSGPREILQGGRFGPLVKIGDVEGMARAMLEVLRAPRPAAELRAAVAEYNAATSAGRYLECLGLQ